MFQKFLFMASSFFSFLMSFFTNFSVEIYWHLLVSYCQLVEPCNFFVASMYLTARITEALLYAVRKCRKVNLFRRVRQPLIMAQKFRNLVEWGVSKLQ